MKFGTALKSQVLVIPRMYSLTATPSKGKQAKTWTSKYAVVGMNALSINSLVDGMNEKGLAGGILYFPGFAKYADPATADPEKSLAPWDFLTWAIGYTMSTAQQAPGLPSVKLAEHIANSFDIPKGWIQASSTDTEDDDYTQWTSIADLSNRQYYVKSYEDQTLRGIDLKSFDLNARQIFSAPLPSSYVPASLTFSTQAAPQQ